MSRELPPLPFFHTKEEFTSYFHDVHYWLPFVEEACWREGIEVRKVDNVPAGDEGTNPVFIINREVVVKLYTHVSEDDNSNEVYQREVVSGHVLAKAPPEIAKLVPALRYNGTLVDQRPAGQGFLHYSISDFLPGTPLSKVWKTLSEAQLDSYAFQLGAVIYKVHQIPIPDHVDAGFLTAKHWASFIQNEKDRAHDKFAKKYKSLPEHLLGQLDTYLPEDLVEFLDSIPLCWIHSDLHRSHTFVEAEDEAHTVALTGIIDWGDALLGSPFFDLAVIHIDQFYGDKKLLKYFLDGYAEASRKDGKRSVFEKEDFVYRCMVNLLLFPYNQFLNKKKNTGIFCQFPELLEAANIGIIADALFNVEN